VRVQRLSLWVGDRGDAKDGGMEGMVVKKEKEKEKEKRDKRREKRKEKREKVKKRKRAMGIKCSGSSESASCSTR
jgi:hypothetical protein